MAKKEDHSQEVQQISNYLLRLSSRVEQLEENSSDIMNEADMKTSNFKDTSEHMKKNLEILKDNLEVLKDSVKEQKNIMRKMTEEFKGIVHKEQFKQLQEKIDEWGPENYVTRNELQKELEK
mgnify:CR=1 FL=1